MIIVIRTSCVHTCVCGNRIDASGVLTAVRPADEAWTTSGYRTCLNDTLHTSFNMDRL